MWIIFGVHPQIKKLGQDLRDCIRCAKPTVHTLKKRRNWFTVFFLPIFPLGGVQQLKRCNLCGQEMVDNQEFILLTTKQCPSCAERIKEEAIICRYCGHKFSEDDLINAKQLVQNQAKLAELQAKQVSLKRRGRILTVFGSIITFISIIMVMGLLLGYFFPSPSDMRKSPPLTLTGLIIGIIILGLILLLGIWMISKANNLRRLTSGSS